MDATELESILQEFYTLCEGVLFMEMELFP